jgi:hypothetical protein
MAQKIDRRTVRPHGVEAGLCRIEAFLADADPDECVCDEIAGALREPVAQP